MGRFVEYDPDELYGSTDRDDIDKWMMSIRDADEDTFTDWENEFIESVEKQLERASSDKPLSGKQLAVLRRLYDKAEE